MAQKFSVSAAWVYSLLQRRRDTGSIGPKEYRRGQKPKLEPYEKEVRQLVADYPDATLVELHALLPNKENVTVSWELALATHPGFSCRPLSDKENETRKKIQSKMRDYEQSLAYIDFSPIKNTTFGYIHSDFGKLEKYSSTYPFESLQ